MYTTTTINFIIFKIKNRKGVCDFGTEEILEPFLRNKILKNRISRKLPFNLSRLTTHYSHKKVIKK